MNTTVALCLLGLCYFLALTVLFAHVAATNVASRDFVNKDGHMSASVITIPLSLLNGFSAVVVAPAGVIMHRIGYKPMFVFGSFLGILSGALCFAATYLTARNAYITLTIGVIPLGCAYGITNYYRHVAAVLGRTSEAASSWNVAIVISSGFLAGIAGPGMADLTVNAFGNEYAGTYLACAVVSILQLICLCFAKIDNATVVQPTCNHIAPKSRPLLQIITQLDYAYAMITAAVVHCIMVLIMGVTPLVIEPKVGFTASSAVIQVHVACMYGPSFLTSKIISKYGAHYVVLTGIAISAIGTSAYFYQDSLSIWHHYAAVLISMTFVGLGWNFAFVGATSMVATQYLPHEKYKAQAFNDTAVFGLGAILILVSGTLLSDLGIQAILLGNICAYIILFILAILYIIWKKRKLNLSVALTEPKSYDEKDITYTKAQNGVQIAVPSNGSQNEITCVIYNATDSSNNTHKSADIEERF